MPADSTVRPGWLRRGPAVRMEGGTARARLRCAAGAGVVLTVLGTIGHAGRVQAPADPSRIVAIGDIHGDFDAFVGILQRTDLVDSERRWTGGDAVLVQTGDFTDRGPRVRATMDLLMALEREAADAGGRVIVLLGNHEAMNLVGDLRDVGAQGYAEFVTEASESRRKEAYAAHVALAERIAQEWQAKQAPAEPEEAAAPPPSLPGVYVVPPEAPWLEAHPPGFFEQRAAFGPTGEYGVWLRQRPAVAQIGSTVFLHGGLDPDVVTDSIEAINARVRREIDAFDAARALLVERGRALPFFTLLETVRAAAFESGAMASLADALQAAPHLSGVLGIGASWLLAPEGPLWFRGFARWTEADGPAMVQRLTERYGADRFVAGHSPPASRRITPRFDRRVFLIDTGMLSSHYGGRASALELRGGRITAIYADRRDVIEEPAPPGPQAAREDRRTGRSAVP